MPHLSLLVVVKDVVPRVHLVQLDPLLFAPVLAAGRRRPGPNRLHRQARRLQVGRGLAQPGNGLIAALGTEKCPEGREGN